VRMTVVRMADGRLWVHDPVAPTQECVDMVGNGGGARHGAGGVMLKPSSSRKG
jgi:hypothetical protein